MHYNSFRQELINKQTINIVEFENKELYDRLTNYLKVSRQIAFPLRASCREEGFLTGGYATHLLVKTGLIATDIPPFEYTDKDTYCRLVSDTSPQDDTLIPYTEILPDRVETNLESMIQVIGRNPAALVLCNPIRYILNTRENLYFAAADHEELERTYSLMEESLHYRPIPLGRWINVVLATYDIALCQAALRPLNNGLVEARYTDDLMMSFATQELLFTKRHRRFTEIILSFKDDFDPKNNIGRTPKNALRKLFVHLAITSSRTAKYMARTGFALDARLFDMQKELLEICLAQKFIRLQRPGESDEASSYGKSFYVSRKVLDFYGITHE